MPVQLPVQALIEHMNQESKWYRFTINKDQITVQKRDPDVLSDDMETSPGMTSTKELIRVRAPVVSSAVIIRSHTL